MGTLHVNSPEEICFLEHVTEGHLGCSHGKMSNGVLQRAVPRKELPAGLGDTRQMHSEQCSHYIVSLLFRRL